MTTTFPNALTRRLLGLLTALFTIFAVVALSPGEAMGQQDQQGTVKTHEGAAEPDPIDQDHPKVCTFHLHGFDFNPDEPIVWWIEQWPGGDATYDTADDLLSNEVTAGEGGDWVDPVDGTYELPNIGPGNDYRLFWDRESLDEQGPDGPPTKHKNFDVECEDDTTTTTVEDTTTTTVEEATTTTSVEETTTTTVAATTTTVEDEVLDSTVTTQASTTSTTAEDEVLDQEVLPFTGPADTGLVILAAAAALAGMTLLWTGRRLEE